MRFIAWAAMALMWAMVIAVGCLAVALGIMGEWIGTAIMGPTAVGAGIFSATMTALFRQLSK